MKTLLDKFMDQIFKRSDGCWIWLGHTDKDGYGKIYVNGTHVGSHRWIYEYYNSPLGNLLCMHTCNNPSCNNPDHLEKGTQSDNTKYCVSSGRNYMSNKTHCKHGHEFTDSNTRIESNGGRRCLECQRIKNSKRAYIKTGSRKIKLTLIK